MSIKFALLLATLCAAAWLAPPSSASRPPKSRSLRSASRPEISCLDEQGRPVDWWIVYKFPYRGKEDGSAAFRSGFAHAYLTSEMVERAQKKKSMDDLHWVLSKKVIDDPESVVMRTLALAYNNPTPTKYGNLSSIFYSDSPNMGPEGEGTRANNRRAHAKGALLMDEITGNSFWITHSFTRFPPLRTMELKFDRHARKHAQHIMCASFDMDETAEQIINHLENMDPLVYESYIGPRLLALAPEADNLREGATLSGSRAQETTELSQTITTRGGTELYIFSKSFNYGDDFYASWMDNAVGASLLVQSWRHGSGTKLTSICPDGNFHVNNVDTLYVDDGTNQAEWPYKFDHSKWAISDDINPGVVCVSDINRMESQFKRGGGAICIKNPTVWSFFSNTIKIVEPCSLMDH